jgi:hypothetical protein
MIKKAAHPASVSNYPDCTRELCSFRQVGLDGIYCDEHFHELEQNILMDADAELTADAARFSRVRAVFAGMCRVSQAGQQRVLEAEAHFM